MPNAFAYTLTALDGFPPELRERLTRLAGERRWNLQWSEAIDEADATLLAPESRPCPRQRDIETDFAELTTSTVLFHAGRPPHIENPGRRLIQFLKTGDSDDVWIAVIENAARAGRALHKRRAYIEKLRRASRTDALTGLYNRVHMLEMLKREYKRFRRTGAPLSALMIDLDHFKNINDTYGHTFGDEVLIDFARLIQGSIRESDVAGRYGGEEFLCLLPETDLNGAKALAEKLRESVEAHVFSEGYYNLNLTASFGAAGAEQKEIIDADRLLACADRALYRAKQTGRNRVCVAGEENGEHLTPTRNELAVASTDQNKPVVLLAHGRYAELPFYEELSNQAGCELVAMADGDRVSRYVAQNTPAVALLQDQLPSISGWDLLNQIRDRVSGERYIPIAVLYNPGTTMFNHRLAERNGVDDILDERMSFGEMNRRLRIFFRLKELHDRYVETGAELGRARARLVRAERLTSLGQMASGFTHDFNNILGAIVGRTDHLMRSMNDENARRELEIVQSAAQEGARTVRRLQAYARSLSNIDATCVPVGEVIEDALELLRSRWKDEAEKQGVHFEVQKRIDPKLTTAANPAELREVFVNLLGNSLDAMPEGGRLEIEAHRPDEAERFVVEIRDSGDGMAPEVARHIFEPFYTTKSDRGTGLGLSVAYGIVARMGGNIEVDSRPGEGTTFRIWLAPHERAASAPEESVDVAPPVAAVGEGEPARAMSVLVVEDQPSVRELFVDVLREEGCEVCEADCGARGMELSSRRRFDVVITDLGMPDYTGWDVAARVKSESPETFVILTTGWSDDFPPEYLADRGVDAWLSKPVSLDELFAMLARAASQGADRERQSA